MTAIEMYQASTDLVDLEMLNTGDLKITLSNDKDARIAWLELYATTYYIHAYAQDDVWSILMEDLGANSEYEILNSDTDDYLNIGALTSAPIIAFAVERDENDNHIIDVKNVWWYPNYAIQDFVRELF